MKVTLSANAGVSIDFANKRIWIDALHQRKVRGFSTITTDLYARLLCNENFEAPDIICYTHCHPDHFSKKMTLDAAQRFTDAKVISPESIAEGWIKVDGDRWEMTVDDLRITYIRLPHEGDAYINVIHYGIILSDGNRNILLPGDCRICSEELAENVSGLDIDLAILDFPWVTLPRGKTFLDMHIHPNNICVYHLPFAEDDVNSYRSASVSALKRYDNRIQLLMEPLQSIQY